MYTKPMGVLTLLIVTVGLAAQQPIRGVVVDATGAPVSGARVGAAHAVTATVANGTFELPPVEVPATVHVSAPGFADAELRVTEPGASVRIVLHPRGVTESLTVSATAGRLRVGSPAAVTVLDAETLATAPAMTIDEQLRTVPGFSLFRRSSSRVANPTTQGVTMRGLAASGASRASVVADGLTLNDPFGGWVYWDRVPAASLESVEVARGGASDVYGSDAMGGAIRLDTRRSGVRALLDGGSDHTARASGFAGRDFGPLDIRGAAEGFTTDGFVVVAPESRGQIDIPAWSRHTSAYGAGGGAPGGLRLDFRGGYFSERRGNGTPFQRNSTSGQDLVASVTGDAWRGRWSARGTFTSHDFDQTFSAVNAARTAERPTSTQHVDASSRAFAADWFRAAGRWTILAAASGRHVDATLEDLQLPAPAGTPPSTTPAIQRTGSLVSHLSWTSGRVTAAGGIRGEIWSTQIEGGEGRSKVAGLVPRMSLSVGLARSTSFRFSFQDSYRLPTINELYRPFRVGNVLTQPNPGLVPEESYGVEGAVLVSRGRTLFRGTVFLASVRNAIVNVTVDETAGVTLRIRENAGRIRARGVESEFELRMGQALFATGSLAWTDSTFTEGPLDGLRVPQVPRFSAAAGVRGTWSRASAALHWRYSSEQFDDDRNQYVLGTAAITDARAAWRIGRGIELFAACENLFDVEQDVGRTPVRTIGLPRTLRAGVRIGR